MADNPRYDFAWAIEDATYVEGVTYEKYKKLAGDAQALGYTDAANKLNEIAVEELRHREELERIIRQTGTSTEALARGEERVEEGKFYYWEITNMILGTRSQTDTPYVTPELAVKGGERYAVENLSHRRSDHMVIKVFDKSPEERAGLTLEPLRSESFWIEDYLTQEGSEAAFPARPFPKTYGDWVNLAEDIKAKYPDDPVMRASVNFQLLQISHETEEIPEEREERFRAAQEAKRWMTEQAGELGIK